jgi:hypothetical protein
MTCSHPRVAIGGNFYVIGECAVCGEHVLAPPFWKAQAGEAGTAETVKQGSVHEHAVRKDAPNK